MKILEMTRKQRKRLLNGVNSLKDLRNTATELCPIEYNTLCELDGLLHLLVELGEFDKEKCEHGHYDWYGDYEYKELLPEEKKGKVN